MLATSYAMNLLNHAAVKRHALELAKASGRPFVRVSAEFIEQLEASLRAMLAGRVPSARGRKTLKP